MVNTMLSRSVHRRLTEFMLRHDEKESPIAFVGREQILASINAVAGILKPPLPKAKTFVIQGAPGAGKTSLVFESSKRLKQFGVRSAVCANPSGDGEVEELLLDTAAELTGVDREGLLRSHKKEFAGAVSVDGLGTVSGSYARENTERMLGTIHNIIRLTNKPAKNPVVVFIDEAQNVREGSIAAAFINTLHGQSRYPLLLVCTGLANTYDQLEKIGLTRPVDDHVFPLGALAKEETMSAAQQSLEAIVLLGVKGSTPSLHALAKEIAVASDNWPRHLTCYLQGVCKTLLTQPMPTFSALNVGEALERGNGLRENYYRRRLQSSGLPPAIVASLYRRLREARISRKEAAGILENSIQTESSEAGLILRRDFPTGNEAIEQALRSGIVTINEHGSCTVPIPSMEGFVIEKACEENGFD